MDVSASFDHGAPGKALNFGSDEKESMGMAKGEQTKSQSVLNKPFDEALEFSHSGSDEPLRQGSVADHFQVDLSGDFAVKFHRDAVLAGAMDFGHHDVAAVNLLLGGVLDGFCHIAVGDRAE